MKGIFIKYGVSCLIFVAVIFAGLLSCPNYLQGVEPDILRVGYSMSFRMANQKDAEIAMIIWVSQLLRQSGMNVNNVEVDLLLSAVNSSIFI